MLLKSLESVDRDVAQRRKKQLEEAIKQRNATKKLQEANFTVGDFLLADNLIAKDGGKLTVQ